MADRILRPAHVRACATLQIGVSTLALAMMAQAAAAQTVPSALNGALPAGQEAAPSITPGTVSSGTFAGTDGASPDPDTPPDNERDEIVVTGVRQSLASAQNIKRNSDTVVDAITAEDIGALPDRSVNEALQRVPGVAISRFAAPNDSQHFSAQGSGVVIRGLSYVRGEFNGRDAFAAGGGREIGFNDIPAEIVGSVEVFKNTTADLIEGGIAGTVSINTRKPFDSKEDLLFLSLGGNYGDLERRASPQGVALVSKLFDFGDGGRFGILGSVTYQQVRTRSDSVFIASPIRRFNDDRNGNGVQDAGEGRTINDGTPYSNPVFDRFPVPTGFDSVYVPLGAGSRIQNFDRERTGYSGAAQYENADRTLLLTAQFLRAESKEDWIEHTDETNNYYGDLTQVFPAPGTSFEFDEDGIFVNGLLTQPNNGGALGTRFNSPQGPNGSYGALQFDPNGIRTSFSNRHFYSKSVTQDASLNLKIDATDRLHLNFDGQYVKSNARTFDDILDVHTFAQVRADLTGSIPQIGFVVPGGDTAGYFRNPDQSFFRNAFNGISINDGREWAFRADAQYDVGEDSFLRNVRVGGRYSDRKQTVRAVDYSNWGNVSETWTSVGPVTFAEVDPSYGRVYNYRNFFRGKAATPPATYFVPDEILGNHDAFMDLLRNVTRQGTGSYQPAEDRSGVTVKGLFRPSEIFPNTEKTYAGYARADFGISDFGNGMSLSGNVGVRFVRTADSSVGSYTFPQRVSVLPTDNNVDPAGNPLPPRFNDIPTYCAFTAAQQATTGSTTPPPAICTVSPAQQSAALAFANGASVDDAAKQTFNHWLPSLNIRFDITPQFLIRGAASRAISRPNFGDLRNFIGLGAAGSNTTGSFGFQGSSRNPFLRPVEANQFDLSAEWYFAKVGQLTGAIFYKELSNIIVDNFGYTRSFSNNGQTFDVVVNGPANTSGKADIKGAELSYQQTYDFLPGLLRGLGAQATYTYVDSGKIPNGVPNNAANDGNRPTQDISGLYDNLPLQGLSKHNVNVAGFYDLGALYARVAYSWRSKFLLTNRDCCFPFLPVYALSTGQLDASAFITVNRNFKLGVTASNLLDETTRTNFLLNGEGLEARRSFFKNDRTYTLTARITY